MRRRRGHRECAPPGVEGGCEVLLGRTCGGGEGKGRGLGRRFMGGCVGWIREGAGDMVVWWMLVAVVVAVLVNLWVGLGRGDVLGMVVAGEGGLWSVG